LQNEKPGKIIGGLITRIKGLEVEWAVYKNKKNRNNSHTLQSKG
jgi:hypothetical protein